MAANREEREEAPLINKWHRQRLNGVAVCQNIFVPWIMFTIISSVMTFSFRYHYPGWAWFICILFLLVVILCGTSALWAWLKGRHGDVSQRTWMIFLFCAMAVAWVAAVISSCVNFDTNTSVFYDLSQLNTYPQVDASLDHGQQLMDASRFFFVKGSNLDISRSAAFKNVDTYCVAPVTTNNKVLANYDFWAVGTNCCSGTHQDFHCGEFNNPEALGGLRLMNDEKRPFYRLAVQQAESLFNIKAGHPLFLEWVQDPNYQMEMFMERATVNFDFGIFAYFCFNFFCVLTAVIFFAKLGYF